MGGSDESLIHNISEAGITAEHPALVRLPVLVAPSVDDKLNTLRPVLAPIACWGIGDARFNFASSFVRPKIAEDAASLADLIQTLTERLGSRPLASVFGHADPIGNDEFNKALSGRRAAAIYALLTRRTEIWEDIYSQKGKYTAKLSADSWGEGALQTMLADLEYESTGPGDEHIRQFQSDEGLAVDGKVGPDTREKLFGAYMDEHCKDLAGEPFSLEVNEFLGGGADDGGKGDFQGCSEFNPLVIFSQEEHQEFSKSEKKAERDFANAPNRRVMTYLFHPDLRVELKKWPCPRAKEGTSACKKRLWVDGQERRSVGESRRLYESTRDTFACRFYDRIARESPCERVLEPVDVRIRLFDACQHPMPGAHCRVSFGPTELDLIADAEGFVRVRALTAHNVCLVEWSEAPDDGQPIEEHAFRKFAFLQVADSGDEAKRRLWNLGYPVRMKEDLASQDSVVMRFKDDYRAKVDLGNTGEVDDRTAEALRDIHNSCEPVPRPDHGRVVPRY